MPPSEQVVSNAEHKRYPVFCLVTASVLRFLPDFITTVRNDPLDRWIADSSSTTHPFEHHINRAFEAACVSEDERSAWISEVKNGFYAANFFAVPLKEIDVNFENVLVDGRSYVGVLRELLVHQKKVQIDVSKLTDTVEAQGDVISSQNQLLTMQEQQIQQLIASSNAQSEHINRSDSYVRCIAAATDRTVRFLFNTSRGQSVPTIHSNHGKTSCSSTREEAGARRCPFRPGTY